MSKKDNTTDLVIKGMQALKEDVLISQFLIPLFEAMGYDDITYHGGRDEQGKDIIMWEKDKLLERRLIEVQVKNIVLGPNSQKRESFARVVTQLGQAFTATVPSLEGRDYVPSEVFFVTPHRVKVRSLQSAFESYKTIRAAGVRILDGPRIEALLKKYRPDLLASLGGRQYSMRRAISVRAHNDTLLEALESSIRKDLLVIYCDIDFQVITGLGRERVLRPYAGDLDDEPLIVNDAEFSDLLDTHKQLKQLRHLLLIEGDPDSLQAAKAQAPPVPELSAAEQQRQATHLEKLKLDIEYLARVEAKPPHEDAPIILGFAERLKVADLIQERPPEEVVLRRILRQYSGNGPEAWPEIHDALAKTFAAIDEIRQGRATGTNQVEVRLDHFGVRKDLLELIEKALNASRLANTRGSSIKDLRDFLTLSETLLQYIAALRRSGITRRILENFAVRKALEQFERLRLSVPLSRAFETGMNLTILGEAGAGKTTNLQVFALRMTDAERSERLIVYAPLPTLIRSMEQSRESPDLELEGALARYLTNLGFPTREESLKNDLRSEGALLLLDSIDEAIGTAPWIIDAIKQLQRRYVKVQIIVTSRASGTFAKRIPFLHLTLSPFTPQQLAEFVSKWFGERKADAELITKHLEGNPELAQVVRNPLAATILCVLQENQVALPATEASLYRKRFELLTGAFDLYKQVRRLRSRTESLSATAQAVALEMHRKKRREAPEEEIRKWARRDLRHLLSQSEIDSAIDELIHPCEILVRTNTGLLDFGHMRFQEYLAAREMGENRTVAIETLLGDPWWQDTFMLYAQTAKEVEWILDRASTHGMLRRANATLKKMFSVRKEPERSQLLSRLASRTMLETEEGEFVFDELRASGPRAVSAADAHFARQEQLETQIATLSKEIRDLDDMLVSLERAQAAAARVEATSRMILDKTKLLKKLEEELERLSTRRF